jgi:uncharacterized membrane protein YeaQ/YmgE (transglycosylase-associated protein family)
MINLSDSAWSCYEQGAVIASLLIAVVLAAVAFKGCGLKMNSPFIVNLGWDFSRSWASNISGLAGIVGISVANSITTDFKPFTQAAIKNSYTVTAVLMAAVVVAAPSVYNLLQVQKNDQLVGCVGGFLAASVLTIWGTIAQLTLQIALLIAFVNEKATYRFGLILVPAILIFGLILLLPYSIRSLRVALANETQQSPVPVKVTVGAGMSDKSQGGVEPTDSVPTVATGVLRKLPLL